MPCDKQCRKLYAHQYQFGCHFYNRPSITPSSATPFLPPADDRPSDSKSSTDPSRPSMAIINAHVHFSPILPIPLHVQPEPLAMKPMTLPTRLSAAGAATWTYRITLTQRRGRFLSTTSALFSAPAPTRGRSKVYPSADAAVADVQSGSTILSAGFGLCGVAGRLPLGKAAGHG